MDMALGVGLISALSLGFVSSLHCVGMCGGIMGALTMSLPPSARAQRLGYIGAYNLGRIITYSLLGALLGGLLATVPAASMALRWIAGALLIAMGLYLANWWRGLVFLEQGGRYLWAYLQPLGKPLLPVDRLHKAAILGGLWGMLPCGLVYSALAYAATFQQAGAAALIMAAFGLGTLPAVFATGVAAETLQRLAQRSGLRYALALLVIGFGLWTLVAASPWLHSHDGAHHPGAHSDIHSDHHTEHHAPAATHSPSSSNISSTASSAAASLPAGDAHHHHGHH